MKKEMVAYYDSMLELKHQMEEVEKECEANKQKEQKRSNQKEDGTNNQHQTADGKGKGERGIKWNAHHKI